MSSVALNLAIFLEKWLRDGEGAMSQQWPFVSGTTTDLSTNTMEAKDKEGILQFCMIQKCPFANCIFIKFCAGSGTNCT